MRQCTSSKCACPRSSCRLSQNPSLFSTAVAPHRRSASFSLDVMPQQVHVGMYFTESIWPSTQIQSHAFLTPSIPLHLHAWVASPRSDVADTAVPFLSRVPKAHHQPPQHRVVQIRLKRLHNFQACCFSLQRKDRGNYESSIGGFPHISMHL